ncbi:porin family protein [Emticicia fluvialis]|uniref:porin family protein n=1 Tax=Emticicia fluvialis TaxID=2974474 RepID=UPI0021668266|nr:porin family protein [Emticicia fluvialis]
MKTRLFLLGALLTMSFTGFAQTTLSWGPKVGVNFTTYNPKVETFDMLTGVNAGLFLNYAKNHWGVMAEAAYSQMGTKVNNGSNLERLHYIQVPVSGVYYFGEYGDAVRPKLFIGPYVGFLASATDNNGKKLSNGMDVRNDVDFGGQVGAGFNFRIKNQVWLNSDVRYMHGFTDVTKEPSTTFRNTGVAINVGVSFPIK